MSRCISRAGEYGDHVLADTGTAVERFVCSRCFVAAEDELFAEVDSLRAELAAERAKVEKAEHLLLTQFYGYDTRELGRAYHADAVDELLTDLRAALMGGKQDG